MYATTSSLDKESLVVHARLAKATAKAPAEAEEDSRFGALIRLASARFSPFSGKNTVGQDCGHFP